MNHQTALRTFWEQGYLVVEDFFDLKLMDRLNALILEHFGDNPAFGHNEEFLGRSRTEVIPWFPQNEGVVAFDEVDDFPPLKKLTRDVLGRSWQRDYCMVMFSKRGTSGQAWHQDCPPENPDWFNLNRLVYSMDITDDIGGQTVVYPGSHRRGELTVGDPAEDFPEQVVLRPRRGTLVLLHGHCWHRVLPIHGRYRFSTNYRARSPAAPDDITDVCVYRNMRYRFSTEAVIEERC